MEHQEILSLLPAYVDQELGIVEALAVERHLNNCADCQRDYATQRNVSARIKKEANYNDAPADLASRICIALPQDASRPKYWLSWSNLGASLAALLVLAWGVGTFLGLPSTQAELTDEVVASHVRSLQVDHLSDVASTDQHTVKPWFNGKLNFSPPVVDLTPQGFPLVGGRLDYLGGRPVAALIYHRHLHPINLYVWPSADKDMAPQVQDRQGYHLAHWTSAGMDYWAVSDLAANELKTFVQIVRSTAPQ